MHHAKVTTNGPIVGDKQIFSNAGINLLRLPGSGTP
jgi:hypothetical protein